MVESLNGKKVKLSTFNEKARKPDGTLAYFNVTISVNTVIIDEDDLPELMYLLGNPIIKGFASFNDISDSSSENNESVNSSDSASTASSERHDSENGTKKDNDENNDDVSVVS